jgi:uncharacterized BrkB/YihY/UPF0761 family membrane protein
MKTLFDLPAHPLLVHTPVVLVPLVTLFALVLVFVPRLRRKAMPLFFPAVFIASLGTVLAARSGEKLQEALPALGPLVDRHAELGEQTEKLAFAMFLCSIAFAAVTMWPRLAGGEVAEGAERSRNAVLASHGFAVLTALLAVITTIWMIRTGHEGARITWDPAGIWGE